MSTAPGMCVCVLACMCVLTHVTYVLPVIDRTSNDQHQYVIDVLSLLWLLMLSLDGATGLLETCCVRGHVCDACV